MKLVIAAIVCIGVLGQTSAASAQQYSFYYYYGAPCCAPTTIDYGWAYTRNQPAGDVAPYLALRMTDGTLACSHGNYRPIRGWCRRIW
jgi:hypothetical protein